MAEERVQRRLAAIISTDVVGYSRMMGKDETGTLARLKSLRTEYLHPNITEYGGRIVKTTGDGTLVEFSSAVDAVSHAVEVQRGMAERNAQLPLEKQILFRIGINVGDIIIDGDDIFGDGVNVAARIESLAEPGGICVSSRVYDYVGDRLDLEFEDIGFQTLKNIAAPVRVFKIRFSDISSNTASNFQATTLPPDKPSVAVLPFNNMSSDPEQDYFADGMTEDLITDLSKIAGLFVVARNTSFAFKAKSVDIKEIGQRLGVNHVLEGSVRRAGQRIRINAQLIETANGGHIWAERFDGNFDDIFALQDDISEKIISALEVHLTSTDKKNSKRKLERNAEAYDLFLKARAEYYRYGPDHAARAIQYLEKALELDPNFADAYGYLSYCYTTAWLSMWPNADETLDNALSLAERAVSLDDNSATALTRLGWVQSFLGQFDQAISNYEKAIKIDPRNAEAYYAFGETMNRYGAPERALPLFEEAFSIETIAPASWEFFIGTAYNLMGRFAEAASKILPVTERIPGFLPARVQLARAFSEMGQLLKAKAQIQEILTRAPDFKITNAFRMFPYPNEDDRQKLHKALSEAGLPE